MSPVERLAMYRTASMGSWVGPAVMSRLRMDGDAALMVGRLVDQGG